jgi:hypothetical protein
LKALAFVLSIKNIEYSQYLNQRIYWKFLGWKSFFSQHPRFYNIQNFWIVRINQSECGYVGASILEVLKIHKMKILKVSLIWISFYLSAYQISDEIVMVSCHHSNCQSFLHDGPYLVMFTVQHNVEGAGLLHLTKQFTRNKVVTIRLVIT